MIEELQQLGDLARDLVPGAWCLPQSAAATWLMRRRGIPARLVLGVRPMPFFAHAWVEVDGHAVAETEDVCGLHVLDRF